MYTLANSYILHVNLIRDLGVTVDSNLKFDKHISLIAHKALVRSRLILKCFHSRDRLLLVKAFCTYVLRCLNIVVLFGLLTTIT